MALRKSKPNVGRHGESAAKVADNDVVISELFEPMLEQLRQQICESDIKSEEDLEQILSLILTIGMDKLELEDINSILNVIMKYVMHHTDKFPSTTLLDYSTRMIKEISLKYNKRMMETNLLSLSWANDLRTVVLRLFQTFKIPEEYLIFNYELCCLTSKILGPRWLCSDTKLAILLASLCSGRLRIIMENEEVKLDQLIACLSLLEDFIHCVENDDSDLLNDEAATSIGKACQEAATYVCQFIVAIMKNASTLTLSSKMDCLLVLYRFLCAFFAIGGAKIMDEKLVSDVFPTLLKVCRFCIEQRDAETSGLLFINLSDFKTLDENVLEVLLNYLRLNLSGALARTSIVQICSALEELKTRQDWYTNESLDEAIGLATSIKDKRLLELVNSLKRK